MYWWALTFFIVSLICAVFGWSDKAPEAAGIARAMTFVFTGLYMVALITAVAGSCRDFRAEAERNVAAAKERDRQRQLARLRGGRA